MNKKVGLFLLINRYFKLYRIRLYLPDNIKITYIKESDFYEATHVAAERILIKGKASSGEILLYLTMMIPS